jgi:hypothetical protein
MRKDSFGDKRRMGVMASEAKRRLRVQSPVKWVMKLMGSA